MARELFLLRHAKAGLSHAAEGDFDRPLTDRGKQEAPKVGRWLRRRGLVPDLVVSSPARRARQTARRVCEEVGFDTGSVLWEPRIYGAEPDTLLEVLGALPAGARRVLLVGHNPGLEVLLAYLGGETTRVPADGRILPTATLAGLELPEDWSRLGYGSGALRSLTRPDEMDD